MYSKARAGNARNCKSSATGASALRCPWTGRARRRTRRRCQPRRARTGCARGRCTWRRARSGRARRSVSVSAIDRPSAHLDLARAETDDEVRDGGVLRGQSSRHWRDRTSVSPERCDTCAISATLCSVTHHDTPAVRLRELGRLDRLGDRADLVDLPTSAARQRSHCTRLEK